MNFQEFSNDIELRISEFHSVELLELHYMAFCFGNGQVFFRINGYIFSFIFDARDNILTISKSERHQKYPDATYNNILTQNGLNIDNTTLAGILS